jgi:hypothetical protein
VAQDADEQETADLARLVEALHPSKEEDERAERFAARLLENPATAESARPAAVTAESRPVEAAPAVAAATPRSWQRDVLMAAIGVVIGVVGTLVAVSIT